MTVVPHKDKEAVIQMQNDHTFNQRCEENKASISPRALFAQIRGARLLPVSSGAGNVSSRYPSRKMSALIQAESHGIELPAIYMWEHSDEPIPEQASKGCGQDA